MMKPFFTFLFLLLTTLIVAQSQIDLPVSFDEVDVDYTLTDFGDNSSILVADPTNPGNTVAQTTKPVIAPLWAGTTIGTEMGFATPIPFTANATQMTVMVYSPQANIPVRLKVEDATDPTKSVETEAMTTAVNTWEMLTFDFSNEAPGTAALNLSYTFDKASIFFNFGTDGATAGEQTYLWDQIEFVGGDPVQQPVNLPVTFEEANVNYDLVDFGGNISEIVTDPTDPMNTVAQSTKPEGAELWAGTTMGENGYTVAIPFSASSTKMTVRVWSPQAGIPIRLKVEDSTDPTKSVETEATITTASTWELLTFDFSNEVMGTAALNLDFTYNKASIFFNFGTDGNTAGTQTYFWDDVQFVNDDPTTTQIDLPVTFEEDDVDYDLTDFGGNISEIVTDPTDPMNTVAQSTKPEGAELWAGTTMGENGFINEIPFTTFSTKMTVRVWSPQAGIPIRLKVEDSTDPTKSVETEATITTASTWELLTFDFSNEVMGTAALNLDFTYNKASIFFNFGTDGNTAGTQTYFWDDVQFVNDDPTTTQIDLPVTFEEDDVDYDLTDFGGNFSEIVTDPTDPMNTVAQTTKPEGAELWAGTTMGENGFANEVPFTAFSTKMTVRVWSPQAGIPIRLKVEDSTDPTKSVETEAMITNASVWDTLTFDFTNEVMGTAALNLNFTYDKASIFFNFGTDGNTAGEQTYYWDDVQFLEENPTTAQIDLPVTFEEDDVDYTLTDFGGNFSEVVVDPTDPMNTVAQSTKPEGAELWAGTTIGTDFGFASEIPFEMNATKMTVRVWSPQAGLPIRLKVEESGDPTKSCETETLTTVASEWETLTFDFSNEVVGTAALNLDFVYNKASIFFNFGTDGNTAGELTFFWDDVQFGPAGPALEQIDLPVTFEADDVDYTLVDFGGNFSELVIDPTDPMNTVAQTTKPEGAELWAGTTMGEDGFATPIPFEMDETFMNVRVWSPVAGIPIRLKVEDSTDPTKSVETEATITNAETWETLTFDFSNEAMGTAPINFDFVYDKASIFFNFGTDGNTAGELTFFWDDVQFGSADPMLAPIDLPVTFEDETVAYIVTDFAGAVSQVLEDPTDPMNTVAQTIKPEGAESFAGTSMGENGFANPIPFTSNMTGLSVRVWSPQADLPILLKVENSDDPLIAAETELMTTVAEGWQTMVFDFTNDPAFDLGQVYDKASIFFNFGTDGNTAGELIFYWDDVEIAFIDGVKNIQPLPLTFFPNPVTDILSIQAEDKVELVQVFNVLGQEVLQQSFESEQVEMDLSVLQTGTYFVRVQGAQQQQTFKVSKR